MPEYPIRDSIITSLSAQEPWPDNVKLYQPYEVEQILLPDNASCLAVQAFLKMCGLPFEVEMRWNAEYMSPSGRVPFIKCGAFVISELEPIVQFVANKGISLCTRLSAEDKAEMRAYMSLITNVLVNAELYISWLDEETFHSVTKVRNSSVYPWPLGWIQTRAKRNAVSKRLKALNWYDKSLDQVLADVEQCCNSLSQRLGEKDYFFGVFPTPLDALVCGHLRALLGASGPKAPLMIKGITTALLKLVMRVSTLTHMKLTPQEQYLVRQALQVVHRGPASAPQSRLRRSRLPAKSSFKQELLLKDVAGYKPFANKQIIMPTKEKCIESQQNRDMSLINEEEVYFVTEVIDDLLDKVYEITDKKDTEKHDFEIVAFSQDFSESNNYGMFTNSEQCLDTGISTNEDSIFETSDAEHHVADDSNELRSDLVDLDQEREDVIQVINDDDHVFDAASVSDTNSVKEVVLHELRDAQASPICEKTKSGVSPTELDALVFGHVFTIITTRLPCRKLAETVRKHESLVALAKRIDEQYFKRP